MSSTRYVPDDPVRAALRRLIDQGLVSDIDIGHLVPPEIQSSWRRSISSRVDPEGQPKIEDISTQHDWVKAADKIMSGWYSSLSNTRTTLLLGDVQGRIVWRRTIDARDGRTLDTVGAVEGGNFSESLAGTNGLGTSIEARAPILVRGSQHFLEALRDVACSAAPIIHPLTGRILGSVSLTADAREANDYMVSAARQASQEIADLLLEGADSNDIALARAFRRARSGRRGVLVMNRDSVMSDLPALSQLDGEIQAQIWDQLISRLAVGEESSFQLADTGLSALVTNVGRKSDPIMELRLIPPTGRDTGQQEGHVAVTGSAVTEPGAGCPPRDADEAVETWWNELTQYARTHPGKELTIPAHHGSDAEAWVRTWSAATGRTARVVSSSSPSRPNDADPHASIGSSSIHVADLAPGFPALRQRRSALADFARAAARGSGPEPRFTAEALAALLSWTWPGDLQELQDVMAHVPQPKSHPWTIDVTDLPRHLASGPRRRLSRWEQAERDSLLEALAESDGNKAHAAALLGIGRTTLYRKLRSLSIEQHHIEALRYGRP